jgi:hypothetical protein
MEKMNQQYLFTCKTCGSHEVMVAGLYRIIEEYTKILPCECGRAKSGEAAIRSYVLNKEYEDYGYLDNEHRWEFVNRNNLIDHSEIEKDFVLECCKCYLIYDIDRNRWKTTLESKEFDEESVEFFVYCGGCGREMEFGWSQPDRSGLIWPTECVDFNPALVWPEPRFKEKWNQKGWFRTGLMFDIFRSETKFDSLLKKMKIKRAF